jgi:DHA3 family multidrug efflux protein-like MFS transporter
MNFISRPRHVGERVQERSMRTFLHVLINTAVANLTTNFLWFALVFWVYLETRSILATGFLSATYMVLLAMSSMWFGSVVDRYKKRTVMLVSAWCSLVAFTVGGVMFFAVPSEVLLTVSGPYFWLFTLILLAGSVVELMRNLALSTTVTLLVPVERHAQANGLVGTVQGIAFIATSVFSGLSIGWLGMGTTLIIATGLVALPIVHLYLLQIPEPDIISEPQRRAVDFRGGMAALLAVPGLLALVLFTTMNNLAGGVFMTLLDPYGLNMFPVELWGVFFGAASTGYIVGGVSVAKWGLGENPIRTMLILVAAIGMICALFTVREWPWLFILGVWCFMALMPAIEASEQTVIQRVVPYAKQGRVFGLAMTFEAAAAPLTAFLIAPLAEFWIVPYVESDRGAAQWEWALGEGDSRGIALIFLIAGLALVALPVAARFTRSYRVLSAGFAQAATTAPGHPHADSG